MLPLTFGPVYYRNTIGLPTHSLLEDYEVIVSKPPSEEYEDFFALWKDADADIPILIEAKLEYGKLK